MATYLQGVTDYIPQFQPFQPDLNLYANVLQTKQTQYDTAWKSINKIYGQYFYSDLTRDNNIKRKDELLKNIDFNLKRVSGLDLSLTQNVSQATQVFKPFYEDRNLMKDMAWTKTYNGQRSRAEGLKNALDEERREQYWDGGVRALDYMRDEFKEASDEEALQFGSVSYTPYVNSIKKAQEIAKEAGLSVEKVEFSPDGRYMVKTKNGENLMEPLSKLFEATLGSDPAIQAVYQTQAYINRKDYAYSNAAQFGGDKNAAEMKYLENSYNVLKQEQVQRYENLKDVSDSYDGRIKDVEARINKGNKDPKLKQYLDGLIEAKGINDSVLQRIKKDAESLSDISSTGTTSTGFQNPYGDIKSLRYKVDNGMASKLMEKDLNEAAQIFAYKDSKVDVEADPYAVNEQKHQFSMQEVAARNAGLANAARIRNAGERKNMLDKALIDSGVGTIDLQTGQVVVNEGYQNTFVDAENEGNATDQVNMKVLSETIAKRHTNQYAVPYLNQSLALLQKLKETGVMTDKQISQVLGYKGKPMAWSEFNKKLQANPYSFLRGEIGSKGLVGINQRLNYWIKSNNKVSAIANGIPGYAEASSQFNDYAHYLDTDNKWRKETSKIVEQHLQYTLDDDLKGYAKFLYDETGKLRSKAQFYSLFDKAGRPVKRPQDRSMLGKAYGWFTDGNADIYNRLITAAGSAYSSGKIKKAPPGVSSIGEMSGTGLFTPGRQSIFVSPKGMGTRGHSYFHEFVGDYRKMDFGDPSKHQITFLGTNAAALKPEALRNKTGKALVDAIVMEMNNSKSKFKNFKMSAQSIIGNNATKGAMILRPDSEWLASQVYKTDKEGNRTGSGIISQGQYDAIMQNGVAIVSNGDNFKNGLYQSSYMDPIQSIVEYSGMYEYQDPYGNLSGTITKNKTGTGDYDIKTQYNILDHETGEYINDIRYENMLTSGNNLSQRKQDWLNMSEQIRAYNNGGY
jgi:hypothetical protein